MKHNSDLRYGVLWKHEYNFSKLTDCPGTGSEQAGKSTACQGCPNQNICASSKPIGPDPGNLSSENQFRRLIWC